MIIRFSHLFFWFLRMRGVLATIDRVRRFTAKEGKSVVRKVRDTARSSRRWYRGLHGFDGDRRNRWPHALWELHFCVLIRASCCFGETGGRSFGLRLAPQARALRPGSAEKLLQFTRNYHQACCLLFTFWFCLRSSGIILDGRASNPYLVEH